jgi:hypothetical protein
VTPVRDAPEGESVCVLWISKLWYVLLIPKQEG